MYLHGSEGPVGCGVEFWYEDGLVEISEVQRQILGPLNSSACLETDSGSSNGWRLKSETEANQKGSGRPERRALLDSWSNACFHKTMAKLLRRAMFYLIRYEQELSATLITAMFVPCTAPLPLVNGKLPSSSALLLQVVPR